MKPSPFGQRDARLVALFASLLIGCVVWASSSAAPERPTGLAPDIPLVLRIYYEDVRDLEQLYGYDVWEYNNHEERYVLAAVDYTGYSRLVEDGWRVAVDEAEGAQLARRENRFSDLYGGYRTVDELYADLEAMNAASPDISELVEYGQSYCLGQGGCVTPGGDELAGYPLLAMRVTNEHISGSSVIDGSAITMGSKPVFFLMANIHAREITTPELAMRFLDYLLDGYANDADATWLVDHHEIWVVPTANPDGHWLVELGELPKYGGSPFYQRKNANNDADEDGVADCPIWPPSTFEQFGIDLNRNHSFGWGGVGASTEPCQQTYRGPSAASENEVAALEAFISALIPDQRGSGPDDPAPPDTTGILITLHSFGDLVLWPWGDRFSAAPNRTGLKAIGDKLASFNGYLSCQAGPCLYRTSGSTDDWSYGELGIPSFTFEIGNRFMPSFQEIDDTQWPDNGPALIYAAKIAGTPYMTALGPVVDHPAVSNAPLPAITATINDLTNGGDSISAAVATIDVPPWQDGAVHISLAAADGAFDESVEEVVGLIPYTGVMPGRHILFVQGQDAAGNWGAVSAAFFEMPVDGLLTEHAFVPLTLNP